MITEIILPKDDANMVEAMIGRWFKCEGEQVSKKAPLVEIITDKAVFELEAPSDGILKRIFVTEKSVVPPGVILGIIGKKTDYIPSDIELRNEKLIKEFHDTLNPVAISEESGSTVLNTNDVPCQVPLPNSEVKRVRATPAAKKIAKQAKIDLLQVKKYMENKNNLPLDSFNQTITAKMVEEFLRNV